MRELLRRRTMAITGGAAFFSLGVLFLLYFFDQFDTAAFGTLAPNIERAFHLTDQSFGVIVVANVSIVLLLAIPISFLGDRVPRTKLVVLGGIAAGVFSFLTGLAGALALFVAVRIGNGLGQLVNDPVHTSLLADYYAPAHRPRVYAMHRNAIYAGAAVGPIVAGAVSALAGWRAAFMVLIVPILVVSFVALRLREPVRGVTDDPDTALEAEAERPVELREAARTLWAVPTLKRQYFAYFFLGAGVIPLAYILPLYFKRAYGLGDFARGAILSSNAVFQIAGLLLAGRLVQRWVARDPGEPLRRTGLVLATVGVGLVLVAAAPNLALAIVLGWATSFIAGMYFPGFLTVQAMVSPARTRTLSFGFGALFLVGGVWVLFFLPGIARISDHDGIRWGLAVLGPYWLAAGAVLASARRFVAGDAARALSLLGKTVELRRQRLTAGERSLLVCSGVDVGYDGVQVLFGVDLDVREGEILALLGTNGAGKSTLLRAISGLVDPAGGAIIFDGHEVTHADARTRAELGIVQMPGGRSVFPTLTVNECLRLAGWLHRKDTAHVRAATERALSHFPVLVQRGETLAGNLSGGEQQMLGLAMALIAKPRLLMIDELSLGLAPTVVSRLVEIVRTIHAQGTTVIIVEQSVNVALTLAQRAAFMEKGEVRFSGPTADLLGRGDLLRSVFLEGAASVVGVKVNGNGRPKRVARRPTIDEPVRLEFDRVVVTFGGVRAVDEASLTVRANEIVGLIGPNGAGKTTLFDVCSGFVRPASGCVRLEGVDITGWSPDRRARFGLGRSFQDARIFPSLTVVENLAVALERHIDVRDPLAAALGLPSVSEAEEAVALRVHELVEMLGLGDYRNKFVGELSTGSRRIVDLGMAIAHRPSVLILDEPSSGIAQREAEALGPLLRRIHEELSCSMLIIEHDMPLVTGISDRMIALELGAVIAEGAPRDVVRDPQVVASYLGDDPDIIARSGALTTATGRRPRKATVA